MLTIIIIRDLFSSLLMFYFVDITVILEGWRRYDNSCFFREYFFREKEIEKNKQIKRKKREKREPEGRIKGRSKNGRREIKRKTREYKQKEKEGREGIGEMK